MSALGQGLLFDLHAPWPPRVGQELELEAHVFRVYDVSPDGRPPWSAGVLELPRSYTTISFVGRWRAVEGDFLQVKGTWTDNPTFGEQLEVTSYTFRFEGLRREDLTRWLERSPRWKGIGPMHAARIVDVLGEAAIKRLMEDPSTWVEAGKIPIELAIELAERAKWLGGAGSVERWLAGFGLNKKQIEAAQTAWGDRAKEAIEQNPYHLLSLGLTWSKVDKTAKDLGIAGAHPVRVKAWLVHFLKSCPEGDCWQYRVDIDQAAIRGLGLRFRAGDGSVLDQAFVQAEAVGEIIQRPGGRWAHRSIWEAEEIIFMASRLLREDRPVELPEGTELALEGSQLAAAQVALQKRGLMVTGAAGTGKTHLAAYLIQLFVELQLRVMVVAPTGKAARRLAEGLEERGIALLPHRAWESEESIWSGCLRPATIHRALGFTGEGWMASKHTPLDVDVVIVDEVSMVDSFLLSRILRYVDLDRVRVLLFGDHHQLPPVGPGNPARDIWQAHEAGDTLLPVVELTEVHRYSGQLREACFGLLEGRVLPSTPTPEGGLAEWSTGRTNDLDRFLGFFARLVEERMPALGLDPIEDLQLLCPRNKGTDFSCQELNLRLQGYFQGRAGREVQKPGRPQLGDKVIQTANDYDLDLMNGEQGIVEDVSLKTNDAGRSVLVLHVRFDEDRLVEIVQGTDAWANVRLAYAITVHKAQGSESPVIVAVLHRSHGRLLQRNLVYTAATRARRHVLLIGSGDSLERAAQRDVVDARRTFLPLLHAEEVVDV